MKIIYFSYAPLTKTLAQSYFIPQLSEQSIEVIYCDCTQVFHLPNALHDEIFEKYIVRLKNFKEMVEIVEKNDPHSTLVVIGPGLEYRFRHFYKLPAILKKFKFATFIIGKNPRPKNLKFKNFKSALKSPELLFPKIFKFIALKFLRVTKQIAFPTIIFSVGCDDVLETEDGKQIFPINYVDYDIAMFSSIKKNYLGYSYILFIDQAQCSHPDFKLLSQTQKDIKIFEERYLNELHNIFLALEKNLKLPVVIAAHPKSNYSEDAFKGRVVIKGETATLIQGASVLLAHYSTASISASMYNIPIHFLAPSIFKEFPSYPVDHVKEVEAFANEFGTYVIRTPEDIANKDFMEINHSVYEKILNTYARSKATSNIHSSVAFFKYLREIFK